jgi:FemAB-related protein (PEP-CTERM system-associated)
MSILTNSETAAALAPALSTSPSGTPGHTALTTEFCTDPALWDAYIDGAPNASLYHLWAWRNVISSTYGHRPHYLVTRDSSGIQGILPLIEIRSRIFGNSLVSMPFFSYGGVVASHDAARQLLLNSAEQLARDLRIRRIELRHNEQSLAPASAPEEWTDTTSKVTMVVQLPSNGEKLWGGLSSGMRNKIRYAQKHGLQAEWSGREAVDSFYGIFATCMRDLGTPVYPRSWFDNMCVHAPAHVRFVTVRDGSEAVASGLVTIFRDTVELPWSGSLSTSRKKYSAIFLYWSVLEWALQNGFRKVDFGRSTRGGGTWEFKRHFSPEELELHWTYWRAGGEALPGLHADNPKFRLATKIWQRLPLPVANTLGPRIVRSIP